MTSVILILNIRVGQNPQKKSIMIHVFSVSRYNIQDTYTILLYFQLNFINC